MAYLRRIMLKVAFDGTAFHGWQRQRELRTVQLVLEGAVQRVVRHPINILGSGRTDAGVHALGHINAFATDHDITETRLTHAIGSRLPSDVAIIESKEVHPAFHATKSALSKLYRYRVFNGEHKPVTQLLQRYTYHYVKQLDVDLMREAARHMVGTHNFKSMTPIKSIRETMVRTVMKVDIERVDSEIRIDIEGKGFLHNQVRNMAGTLIEVGRGRWEPDHVKEIIAGQDRNNAGPTAPACGLCLMWVKYPPELLVKPDEPLEGATAPLFRHPKRC